MKQISQPTFSLFLTCLFVMAGWAQALAWDAMPGGNGKYDAYYDRPTHFPDWEQPSDWPNAEYYLVCARLGEKGPRLENYEVAVYDQNGNLRHCNRSLAKDNHLCVLTIRGTEGDQFHCQIVYGDPQNPTVADVTETFGFKTNDQVGTSDAPFYLTVPGRTYFSEDDTDLPEDETDADVTVVYSLDAGEWSSICLPFDMNVEQIDAAFGEGVELGDFQGCDVKYETDGETVKKIDAKFETVTAIAANHPYIIKVSRPVSEFEVDGVDIHAEAEPSVDCDRIGEGTKKKPYLWNSFVGNYVNGTLIPEDCLFLSGGNFQYSTGTTEMKAYRGYFDFYDVLPEGADAASCVAISFGGGTTTGITQSAVRTCPSADVWYTIDGRRLSGKPGTKGVYISRGRKVFVY